MKQETEQHLPEAAWRTVKPRIPDTPQRRQLERQRSVREIVFGAQDGILTTLGIVTLVGVASNARLTVLVTGIASLIAGALSMAAGEYQGRKSEREVVKRSIETEQQEMAQHPKEEFAEQVAYYKLKGFTADEAQMIVKRLEKNPEIYFYEMMRDEFGIDPRIADSSAFTSAAWMGLSFAAGSVIPIIPYLFASVSARGEIIGSCLLALAGLFGVGFYAASLGAQNRWLRAVEIMLFGSVVFGLSYVAGYFIPMLFGVRPAAL